MGPEARRDQYVNRTMRLILHIGQHKTGSKALQSALYANRPFLADYGFCYPLEELDAPAPKPQHLNHFTLFEAIRAQIGHTVARPGGLVASHETRGGDAQGLIASALRRMIAHAPAYAPAAILSAEDLFHMHTAHEMAFSLDVVAAGTQALASALRHMSLDAKIVCYVRRQDHLLAAHYAQLIKGGGAHLTFEEFARLFAPRLDTHAVLQCWERAFGQDSLVVSAYEPHGMPGGIVSHFFQHALGIPPPPEPMPFPDDLESQNITPSRDHIEYMRCMNRRISMGLPTLPRQAALESAFADHATRPAGIAAWLSPAERGQLLSACESGNRSIARRHGFGDTLFREPPPDPADRWEPCGPPSLARLVSLDAMARERCHELVARRHRGGSWLRTALRHWRRTLRTRHVLVIAGPHATRVDEQLAAALVTGVMAARDLELALMPTIAPSELTAVWRRVACILLVGPVELRDPRAMRAMARARRCGGMRVVQVVAHPPVSGDSTTMLTRWAPVVDTLVCPDSATARQLAQAIPDLVGAAHRAVLGDQNDLFLILERLLGGLSRLGRTR